MHKKQKNNTIMKATISNLVVAFIYAFIIVLIIGIFFSSPISKAISLINTISIDTNKEILKDVKIDLEHNQLESYPDFGSKYANIIIEDLDINLPLYYGDTYSILRYGVGQSITGYFPGEGKSIICMGHNSKKFLRKLPQIKIGTKIRIETVYGNYTYTAKETKIVHQSELDAIKPQREKEILTLYTCYPVDTLGYPTQRFIVYAPLD